MFNLAAFNPALYRGALALAVNVVVAVAGALNAPDIAATFQDLGVAADQAITAAVAVIAAATVFVGAVSAKFEKAESETTPPA